MALPRTRRNLTTSPQMREMRGRIYDNLTAWADQLRQANRDTSMLSAKRFVRGAVYGELLWLMRSYGEEARMRALARLYDRDGAPNTWPDPRVPTTYSRKSVVVQVMCDEEIETAIASEHDRMMAQHYLPHGPMLAWLQTFPDGRPPTMVIDLERPPDLDCRFYEDSVAWDIANVLARYLPHASMYRTPGAPGERLTPPDMLHERVLAPLFHNFAKGLLLMDRWCAEGAPCMCNTVIYDLGMAPPGHQQHTGALVLPQETPPPWQRRGPTSGPHTPPNGPKSRT